MAHTSPAGQQACRFFGHAAGRGIDFAADFGPGLAMYGQKVKASGGLVEVMNTNRHLSVPVMIGEIQANRQFDIVWQTKDTIKADACSPYLTEDKGKIADWTYPCLCGNCPSPKYTN